MAQIHGQIDSLKQIRRTLDTKGVGRFNSVNELHDFLKNYKSEEKRIQRHTEVLTRSEKEIEQLAQIKEEITNLNPQITRAIGENLVLNELEKLSDDYILINNFSLDLDTPLYYKKDKNKIRSIQIDHLLISKAGIFIIETKNWSKRSINSSNFRSPVAQINRSSYALSVLLSKRNINLKNHVWGANKEIPIRNIVVTINKKPKGQFKHVKIKTLNELNAYIDYFEPIFNDKELNKIYIGLISLT